MAQEQESQAPNLGSIPCAAMSERSFILATSAIHLITMVPACLLGLTKAKVMLSSLIHPSIYPRIVTHIFEVKEMAALLLKGYKVYGNTNTLTSFWH